MTHDDSQVEAPLSMSQFINPADYWQAMYQRREAEANALSEEIIQLRTALSALAAGKQEARDSHRELVAYHDKDQPNGVAWCPGYPEKLPDIVPPYAGELTSKRLARERAASPSPLSVDPEPAPPTREDWTDDAACLSELANRLEQESADESERGNDSAACAWSCRACELRQIVTRMVTGVSVDPDHKGNERGH